ncbi:MAG: hypothetical protein EBU13_10760 [Synechococcaceae bacterium WB5_2A_257]|nr:hypothetical protein [Synechococcaceae bacterium WB5_2A_257]
MIATFTAGTQSARITASVAAGSGGSGIATSVLDFPVPVVVPPEEIWTYDRTEGFVTAAMSAEVGV